MPGKQHNFMFPVPEVELWREAAEREGISLTEFLRLAANDRLGREAVVRATDVGRRNPVVANDLAGPVSPDPKPEKKKR